jgi:hypothetical protein
MAFDLLLFDDGQKLLQLGTRPVRFIVIIPGNKRFPLLYTYAWEKHKRFGPIAWGTTKKPIDVRRLHANRTSTEVR